MNPARTLLAMLLLVGTGCAHVEPWERGTLASDRMAFDPNPDESTMTSARRRTREEGTIATSGAAASANASAGGGCGCH